MAGAVRFWRGSPLPPPLPPSEEAAWLKRLTEGDPEALEVLTTHNVRLVLHLVHTFTSNQQEAEELTAVGCLGLVKALKTFRIDHGAKLSSYAARCILNEILMHFRRQSRQPAELPLSSPVGQDTRGRPLLVADVIQDDTDVAESVLERAEAEQVQEALQKLPGREREVLSLRFGFPDGVARTQAEVAAVLRLSRAHISRVERRALQRLRRALQSDRGHAATREGRDS